MKKIVGLLKIEWAVHKIFIMAAYVLGIAILYVLPLTIEKMGDLELSQNSSMGLVIAILIVGALAIATQFLVSIRDDVRKKELWLHSTSSIYQLVGVKVVFIVLNFVVFSFIFTALGMYPLDEIFVGPFLEVLLLQVVFICIATLLVFIMCIQIIIFSALYYTLKRYIWRFASIVTIVIFFFTTGAVTKLTSSSVYKTLMHNGEIDLTPLMQYLPDMSNTSFTMSLGSFYLVEELFMWLILFLIFTIGSRWLEKVILR